MQNIVALRIKEAIEPLLQTSRWIRDSYSGPSPAFIKRALLAKHGIASAPWIETGTYLGGTTKRLAEKYPHVTSIEPNEWLCQHAKRRLQGYENVTLLLGTSEQLLEKSIIGIGGERMNLWLDGHYSSGVTYHGENETPIMIELDAVSRHLARFSHVKLFIDDIRCFVEGPYRDLHYPDIDKLVAWCKINGAVWHVEHDIFIAEIKR